LELIRGINYGVDFRGGTLLQYHFAQEVTAEQIRKVLDEFDLSARHYPEIFRF
jgi:preprotein translocase subunit SecF